MVEYFGVDMQADLPIIAAHQPSTDFRFKSPSRLDLAGEAALMQFVQGVIAGQISKVLKSEPVPAERKVGDKNHVVQAVGTTVLDIVSVPDKDVLLFVHSSECQRCKRVLPTYDILSRAVAGEPRIVIAKIDSLANDIPSSWGVTDLPAFLWFPASDKPYTKGKGKGKGEGEGEGEGAGEPTPKPYWDAGYSLVELVGFVQRESSFDVRTLRVATSEQLGSLMVRA